MMDNNRFWKWSLRAALLAASILGNRVGGSAAAEPQDSHPWEAAIAKMIDGDRDAPPPSDGIVFVGSSSIRFWDLAKFFPKLPAINRGFGGSQIADSIYFADRIILPYRPRIVVIYAGDNDIAAGKSPEEVAADFRELVKTIYAALPQAKIAYIAIKPSIARWKLVKPMRRANALIKAFVEGHNHGDSAGKLVFVDVDAPMIGGDGKPRKDLFRGDGLHLNDDGYALWTKLVRPHLDLDRDE